MESIPHMTCDTRRRSFLWSIGGGFGGLAMSQMLTQDALASGTPEFNGGLHHPARAKRIIQLFMTGGASPMDTFDYKPELENCTARSWDRRKNRRDSQALQVPS